MDENDNGNQTSLKQKLFQIPDKEEESDNCSQVSKTQSSFSEEFDPHDENSDHIYDLPKMENITKTVLAKLLAASIIALLFLIAEIIGGILASSLAILSDAAHMFSDLTGFFISIFSVWIGTKPASMKLSYGYHRAEVIGALASIVLIWGLTILLLYEATHRIIEKEEVQEPLIMLITASFGLCCNIIMAKVLHSAPGVHHHHGCSHDHGHDHSDHNHDHDHNHNHDHEHDHDHDHCHENEKEKNIKQEGKCNHTHGNEKKGHSHNHHDHDHDHDHHHDHKLEDHDHDHDSHNHNHEDHNHEHNDDDNHNDIPLNNGGNKNRKRPLNINGESCIGTEYGQSMIEPNEEDIESHLFEKNQDSNHRQKKATDKYQILTNKKTNKIKATNMSVIEAKDNYNLRAAMIHVIGDIVQSIGVLIAAFLIYFLGGDSGFNNWHLADPICTYLFSILVLFTTFSVAKECIRVLMEGTPNEIDMQEFSDNLKAIKYVVDVHDLHIWSLSKGKPSMTCHIFVSEKPKQVLKDSTRLCRQYGIYHSTVQIEEWSQKGQRGYIKCDHNIHH